MKRSIIMLGLMSFTTIVGLAAEKKLQKQSDKEFYVYTERGSKLNHWIPSGYMGNWGSIKINQSWTKNPAAGQSCVRIEMLNDNKQGAGWAGVYWQYPVNNWGDKRGGYNLEGYKKFTFMARGEKGGEVIDKFGIGGITGQTEEGDTDQAEIGAIELTKEWKKYEIDLKEKDLSHIIGGFVWATADEMNPNGAIFYLDEIRYEK